MIVLTGSVVCSTYQRFHLARMRIETDQGHLRLFERSLALAMALRDDLPYFFHAQSHRIRRVALQFWIERGVDFRA